MFNRKGYIFKAAATVVLMSSSVLSTTATAQEKFPSKPVTLINPWPAGGAADGVLRGLAKATEPFLGQSIVVENKPGAGGTLGPAVMVKTAKPDGYTISQVTQTQFRLPHMQNVNFDPIKDFSYIIRLTGYTFGLVVNADSPHQTIQDFIAYAKNNPGKISYGSGGNGTSHHVAMAVLGDSMGIDWQHIPFKGSSENLTSLMGKHVDAASDSTGWAPHVETGKMRLLATYGEKRADKWPDVPTLHEIFPGLVFDSPYGLAAPAGTPTDRIQILHDAFKKGLESEEFKKVMFNFDQTNRYMNTADYIEYNHQVYKDEEVLMKKLGLYKQ